MKNNTLNVCLTVFLTTVATSCGTIAGNPNQDDTGGTEQKKYVQLPDISRFNLASLGQAPTLRLQTATDCAGALELGVLAGPVAGACLSNESIQNTIYGTDPDLDDDGEQTCNDYQRGRLGQGVLHPLLCDDIVVNNQRLITGGFDDDVNTYAVSFADFATPNNTTAIGHWSSLGEDATRFPGKLRGWTGKVGAAIEGVFAFDLVSLEQGSFYFDYRPFGLAYYGEINYSQIADASGCAAAPSAETCHRLEIRGKGEEEPTTFGVPSGTHVIVLMNDMENPTFTVLEGKYGYSSQAMDNFVTSSPYPLPAGFKDARAGYYRFIQKDNELWGSSHFTDASGQTISATASTPFGTIDIGKVLRDGLTGAANAGICQEAGSATWQTCRTIKYGDYNDLWIGESTMSTISTTYELPIEFGSAPAAAPVTAP